MNNKDREKIISELLDECERLRQTKGVEYSNDVDMNANFKSDLDIGISPEKSCMVFTNKHYRAVRSFIRSGTTLSENIEGRIADLINYLLILHSLLKEKKDEKATSGNGNFGEPVEADSCGKKRKAKSPEKKHLKRHI